VRVVLCNCSPGESARLAETLVREHLAACVSVISGVRSYYAWEGEYCEDDEHTLVIKTTAQRYSELEARLDELHSYDTPEIVALDAAAGLERYLDWVAQQTS